MKSILGLPESLPKNHSWANYPFDKQNVCMPPWTSVFIFLVLTKKKNPNPCHQQCKNMKGGLIFTNRVRTH